MMFNKNINLAQCIEKIRIPFIQAFEGIQKTVTKDNI